MSGIKVARKPTNAQARNPTPAPKKESKGSVPKSPPLKPRAPAKTKSLYSANHEALLGYKLLNEACGAVPPTIPEAKVVPSSDPLVLGFGHRDPIEPRDLYLKNNVAMGNTGSVTTKTELGLTVTDFFDYSTFDASGVAQEVTNYFWSVDQNLFQNSVPAGGTQGRERTFCRVRKVEVFVLPAKGFEIGTTGPNETNAKGMFTVNCQCPGVSSVNTQAAIAMDTQVTNVLPQIDTFWKKVFTCDLQKTFQSGVVKPYFDTVVDNFAQCIFQMSIVDPDTGLQYLPDDSSAPVFSIRVKVVLHIDQPIATIQNAKLRVFKNESFITPSVANNGPAFTEPTEEYVQVNLRRAQDYMR
jgi:hypothetical protein